MKRILPFPILAVTIFVMWALLTGFSIGHLFLGAIVAVLVSRTMLTLRPEQPNVRVSRAILRLIGLVLLDIFWSNVATAKVILSGSKSRNSGFVSVPVKLRSPYALSALSMIMTATPGTVWVQHDPSRQMILIHFLDMQDAPQWIENYRNKVERLLMEIFE